MEANNRKKNKRKKMCILKVFECFETNKSPFLIINYVVRLYRKHGMVLFSCDEMTQ